MRKPLIFAVSVLLSSPSFAADFSLTSDSVVNGQPISNTFFANQFGCDGANEVPDLSWNNVPQGTKSFALTYFDMDAPTGSGFWHWSVFDIPGNVTHINGGINGGKLPVGTVEGKTDVGAKGFIGSCPQIGEVHRYQWKLTALDVAKLPVDSNATPQIVALTVLAHKIDDVTLTVLAGRK
ncbi:YbhB/YbcL family Raf kinase inhibitor-like protein [Photobacterium swingsii]|uniref:YbhB/YbcL family Raf kinase inhibitor-like protein n=1 Tax=Photobacterium swingsii TaxID=680026 RepID=A0A0J8VEH7_9GAMM|nr:YbhB/YbcL family Raf kinase inhibitor-like protein [Photobacterium swingsii]KMV30930.1 hypothetical protein AB733_07880 [Photobacterium swingsii]PSW23400.1 YbhB/YbcL family Raf kinase inhibitor-like protein [Photobacterium swingsii]